MLERLRDLPASVVGLKASGKVTAPDYKRVVHPLIAAARRDGRSLRIFYELGSDFEGFSVGGAWQDARSGFEGASIVRRCAVVSDAPLVRTVSKAAAAVMPCPIRVFTNRDREHAIEWLSRPPEQHGLVHHLIPETGVVVVKGFGPLTAEDAEAVETTVDDYIGGSGTLNGLVVRPKPASWDKPGSLLYELAFVRRYRGRVRRLAVVADGVGPWIVAPLANRWLGAETRLFPMRALDDAIAWAGRDASRGRTRGNGTSSEAFDRVQQASVESFPASDAPSFTPEAL